MIRASLCAVAVMASGAPSLARSRRQEAPSTDRRRERRCAAIRRASATRCVTCRVLTDKTLPPGDPVGGAEAEPGGEVTAGREGGESGPEFREQGEDAGRRQAGNPREGGPEEAVARGPELEAGKGRPAARRAARFGRLRPRVLGRGDRGGEAPAALRDLAIAGGDQVLGLPVGGQGLAAGEEVLRPVIPHPGLGEGLGRRLDAAITGLGQPLRVPLPIQNGVQNGESGHPGEVAQHGLQLAIQLGPGRLHMLGVGGGARHQAIAMAQEGANRADCVGRPEGGPQQPHRVQSLEPLAVLDVARPAGGLRTVAGVHQADRDPARLPALGERNPVDAGRLHRHRRAAALPEPVRHGVSVLAEGPGAPEGLRGPGARDADVDRGGPEVAPGGIRGQGRPRARAGRAASASGHGGASRVKGQRERRGRQAAQVGGNSGYSFQRDRPLAGDVPRGSVPRGLRPHPGTMPVNGLRSSAPVGRRSIACLCRPRRRGSLPDRRILHQFLAALPRPAAGCWAR